MSATSHDLHIDALLSEMAMGYRPEGFIADMIFPTVTVGKQSNLYAIFNRGDRLRRQDTKRAPGTLAKRIEESVSSATYYCNNYALAKAVTIEDRSNADPLYLDNLINGGATLVLDHLMLDWEVRVANQVTSGSNVGSYSAVASAWNGAGNPIGNINTAIDNVHYSNGVKPNRIVFGVDAWKSFRRDSNVRNLIFGTNNGGGYPSTAQVAELLDLDQGSVMVGGAFANTGGEGNTESLSRIWKDNVLVYYAPPSPTIERPSFGYNFRWSAPGLPQMQVERHAYDTRTKSELLEVGYYQDEVITGSTYGFLISSVNSSGSGI